MTQGRKQGAVRHAGLRALAMSLPRVTEKALGRRGFAEAGLLADWSSVVGSHLANLCAPCKLAFAKRGERRDGTLTLRVESGHGPTLQHLEPQLLERINAYFGYAAVARLRLQQGPLPRRKTTASLDLPGLSGEEENDLCARVSDVEDEELRQALLSLGQSMGRRAKT